MSSNILKGQFGHDSHDCNSGFTAGKDTTDRRREEHGLRSKKAKYGNGGHGADRVREDSARADEDVLQGCENNMDIEHTVAVENQKQRQSHLSSDSDKECDKNGHIHGGDITTTFLDMFEAHLGHTMSDDDFARLPEGKAKFITAVSATGLQEAKWLTTSLDFPKAEMELSKYGLKQRLTKHWQSLHKDSPWGDFQSQQQCQFFSFCNSYQDIFHSNKMAFYMGTEEDDTQIMNAYLLHILNHVWKTRDLVTKNNEKLSHQVGNCQYEPPRDQGFTRPKVLILLPLRSMALRVVKKLLDLVPQSSKVGMEHLERFVDDFGVEDYEKGDSDADKLVSNDSKAKDKEEIDKINKPVDFQALFGGNNDDHFRVGIKFTRKAVKFYSKFYSSDIIVASPLGLVTRVGEKDKDTDFLSSIEILVIDYADVILMQNWTHVVTVMEQLNRIPSQQHGTDFMRIREWYLDGHGRYYRQNIILSAFPDAGMNALFYRGFLNFAGKLRLQCGYKGVLSKILRQVRQVYMRIDCSSLVEVDTARFEFFTKQVFPQLKDSFQGGILIFISSYFDFVRLRNFLKAQNASFCLFGEYTKQSDISRARAWFFHGRRRIMLYTERAHFYHRYKIRGIKELVFYSLPEHAEFYSEITNMLDGLENPSSTVLFSQFDNLQLERVVGTPRAKKMLYSKNGLFMFC